MDIMKFAIEMELDGEKYYTEQAEKNIKNSLYTVFKGLAAAEANHAKLLKDSSNGIVFKPDNDSASSAQSIFDGLDDFKVDIKRTPDQIDAYRLALEKEKESIELYKKLSEENKNESELLSFLISQEEEHYKLIDEIIKLVSRPIEWVEAAEFGIREEY